MVKYSDEALDRTFAALADPTRRALLARLGERDSISVSELAQPFAMSLPAIMKHLDVLSDAGLIARAKTGRIVACRLTAEPMEQAMDWLNRYQRFWSDSPRPPCRFCGGRSNGRQIKRCRRCRSRHPTEPHPQASSQRAAGESLRGVDRPGKNSPLVRTGAGQDRHGAGQHRRAGRRTLSRQLRHGERRTPRSRRRLSRGGAERAAGVQLGLAFDAGTGIAGDGFAETRRRRHAADADPRAILRSGRPRRP